MFGRLVHGRLEAPLIEVITNEGPGSKSGTSGSSWLIWALDDEVISKICTLHMSGSYFPIACATGATDEKRSATAHRRFFIF